MVTLPSEVIDAFPGVPETQTGVDQLGTTESIKCIPDCSVRKQGFLRESRMRHRTIRLQNFRYELCTRGKLSEAVPEFALADGLIHFSRSG